MELFKAINEAVKRKLSGEPVGYTELADKCGVHPEKLRSKVRRKLAKHHRTLKTAPKVLVFDIETAPMLAYIWNRFQKYIDDGALIEDWFVLSWAGKWLFDDKTLSDIVTPEEAVNRDDRRVVESLWKLLDEADMVIAHNGLKFDVKHMNGRFIKYGMNLPSPYQVIDTYRHSVRSMKLPSHKLDYIAKYLGLGQKKPTNFKLWIDCMHGNEEALRKMDEYCIHDVKILEDVYLKMRPFIQPHPNFGVYIESDVEVCPACGSDELEEQGTYATTVNLYDAFRCKNCGSLTRSRRSAHLKREHITSSLPR